MSEQLEGATIEITLPPELASVPPEQHKSVMEKIRSGLIAVALAVGYTGVINALPAQARVRELYEPTPATQMETSKKEGQTVKELQINQGATTIRILGTKEHSSNSCCLNHQNPPLSRAGWPTPARCYLAEYTPTNLRRVEGAHPCPLFGWGFSLKYAGPGETPELP